MSQEDQGILLSTISDRGRGELGGEYRAKDREVKRTARNDRRDFLDGKARQTEETALRGEHSTVYKLTSELRGTSVRPSPVKDTTVKIITTERGKGYKMDLTLS